MIKSLMEGQKVSENWKGYERWKERVLCMCVCCIWCVRNLSCMMHWWRNFIQNIFCVKKVNAVNYVKIAFRIN